MASTTYKGIDLFTGNNYASWSERYFAFGLTKGWAREVLERPAPTDADELLVWSKKNDEAYAIFSVTLSPSQLLAYRGVRDANKILASLRKRFGETSSAKGIEAFDDLAACSWRPGEDLESYLTRSRTLRQRCAELKKDVTEEEAIFYLLKGVTRPDFHTLKTVLKEKSGLDVEAVERSLREYMKDAPKTTTQKDDWGHPSTEAAITSVNAKKIPVCWDCRKEGHVRSRRPEKNANGQDKPPERRQRTRQEVAQASRRCYVCGSAQHLAGRRQI